MNKGRALLTLLTLSALTLQGCGANLIEQEWSRESITNDSVFAEDAVTSVIAEHGQDSNVDAKVQLFLNNFSIVSEESSSATIKIPSVDLWSAVAYDDLVSSVNLGKTFEDLESERLNEAEVTFIQKDVAIAKSGSKYTSNEFIAAELDAFLTDLQEQTIAVKKSLNDPVYQSVFSAQSIRPGDFRYIKVGVDKNTAIIGIKFISFKEGIVTFDLVNFSSVKQIFSHKICTIDNNLHVKFLDDDYSLEANSTQEFTVACNDNKKIFWYDEKLNSLYQLVLEEVE